MASYEPHKMLSLKIAGLSKADQKWILKQLPKSSQEKIKSSLKFVHKFSAANPNDLLAQLMSDEQVKENSEDISTSADEGFSDALREHLSRVVSGQITLAQSANAFVLKAIEGSDNASY